jgi:hypothetical protein
MDPVSLTTMALIGTAGATAASALTQRPGMPNLPPPIRPPEQPRPKPRPKASFQDSFLTGVAGQGVAPMPRGKTLLGE